MVTTPTPLSPAANAVWEAFNQDEAGVFVDYGDKLAAALRAAADQVVPLDPVMPVNVAHRVRWDARQSVRYQLLAIAAELEGNDGPA
jgi:hypothetical protein